MPNSSRALTAAQRRRNIPHRWSTATSARYRITVRNFCASLLGWATVDFVNWRALCTPTKFYNVFFLIIYIYNDITHFVLLVFCLLSCDVCQKAPGALRFIFTINVLVFTFWRFCIVFTNCRVLSLREALKLVHSMLISLKNL